MTGTVQYVTEDDAQMTGSTILHVGKDGEPVLLEILDASTFVGNLSATIAAARNTRDAA